MKMEEKEKMNDNENEIEKLKKSNSISITIIVILVLIIILGGGYLVYSNLNSKIEDSKVSTSEKDYNKDSAKEVVEQGVELDESSVSKIIRFLNATSNKIFVENANLNNFGNDLGDIEKMAITLSTYFDKLPGGGPCNSYSNDVLVKPSDLPVLFKDMSFIEKYKSNGINFAYGDYQDAHLDYKGSNLMPYLVKVQDGNFYVNNSTCGSVGPKPYSMIAYVSSNKTSKELTVDVKYFYASPKDNNGEITRDFYSKYNGSSKDIIGEGENYNIENIKAANYTITFDVVNNGYIVKNVKFNG